MSVRVRGVHPILPSEWSTFYRPILSILQTHSYLHNFQEIQLPVIEPSGLYERCISNSDIVHKELYRIMGNSCVNSTDEDCLVLRPEGTAGAIQTLITNNNYQKYQKISYFGQMFRRERPQKGRLRQFNQFGIEHFNDKMRIESDAEGILMLNNSLTEIFKHFFCKFENYDDYIFEINSIGQLADRQRFKAELQQFTTKNFNLFSQESQFKIKNGNYFNILDSKNEKDQEILSCPSFSCPKIIDFLSVESRKRFDDLIKILNDLKIPIKINHYLVRGLDYYSETVFEVKMTDFNSIAGGGRYDGLSEMLGGPKGIGGFGWAIGIDRLVGALKEKEKEKKAGSNSSHLVCLIGLNSSPEFLLKTAKQLRENNIPTSIEIQSTQSKNFNLAKSLTKLIENMNPSYLLFCGQKEQETGQFKLKKIETSSTAAVHEYTNNLQEIIKIINSTEK